jgi:hypothetical protein
MIGPGDVIGANLRLLPLDDIYDILKLAPDAPVPGWVAASPFCSITRSSDELSIVCLKSGVPQALRSEREWSCLKVLGPLDFALTGILLAIAAPLAAAEISIFAVSTYDTDYVLIERSQFARALVVLRMYGHAIA